jgi:hypothetical protein
VAAAASAAVAAFNERTDVSRLARLSSLRFFQFKRPLPIATFISDRAVHAAGAGVRGQTRAIHGPSGDVNGRNGAVRGLILAMNLRFAAINETLSSIHESNPTMMVNKPVHDI